MSSSQVPLAVPKHSSRDDDHALVLPGSSTSSGDATTTGSSKQSATAALSRALAGMLAFMFKRPIRLFRPVKISTWAGIQAIAEEQGRSVTPGFVRGLLRQEGWRFIPRHVLPPLFVNTAIGLTLFTAYTTSETLLLPFFTSPSTHLLLVPFLSGAFAGAAQALLSAPLDNARLLLFRRQRFLRLSHAASSSNPRVRRTRLAAKASAGGVPFVSWLSLLRDSVFQSSRNAIGGTAAATARERLEQGRRWARRGWSLFNLSLVKDACGFGVFFLIFEVGREGARVAGLNYDGIDPDKPEEEGKQRRSASGLVLQSLGILISGGLAGWVFGLVARPFERMRGAIWEGRARWAERDGRLKVIEELALAGTDPLAESSTASPAAAAAKKSRRRRVSAGGASERRAHELVGPTGRKEFRVRIGRIRTVTRGAFLIKRRKGRQKERERLLRVFEQQHQQQQQQAPSSSPAPAAASTLASPSPPPPPPSAPSSFAFAPAASLRRPMPPASSLVLSACQRYGTFAFLFAPRSTLSLLDSALSRSSSSSSSAAGPAPLAKPMPPRKVRVGPTRLSARGKMAVEEARKQAGGGRWGWRRAGRVLSYVPPYAVGLLFYALTAGDLKIEV
ncbi:hypothetical protein JCM6882_002988 [Rhodosporidiobolus microsporus]